jgi:hypothetical protein
MMQFGSIQPGELFGQGQPAQNMAQAHYLVRCCSVLTFDGCIYAS